VAHPAAAAPLDSAKGKARFALQLGSFPDRAEAEAFAKKFGAQSYVVASDIPGKGVWYRVRVGDYPSTKEAIAAKASFEKQHSVIAYVVSAAPSH
jgi:DedD protein